MDTLPVEMKWEIAMHGYTVLQFFMFHDTKFRASMNPIIYNKLINRYKRTIKTNDWIETYFGPTPTRHSFNDNPAVVHINGNGWWYKFGKLHRDTFDSNGFILPAITIQGIKFWYKNGMEYFITK